MSRNNTTSAIVDGILRTGVIMGTLSVAVVAPNLLKALDPATQKLLRKLDKQSREREIQRCLNYALRERLITEGYQHGIALSKKGQNRLAKRDYDTLSVKAPKSWDKAWRLVFFDIPKSHDKKRRQLTQKLRSLGFQPLQQSIWIYPYPCKPEIQFVTDTLGITTFVTYIKTLHIDHEEKLISRFSL